MKEWKLFAVLSCLAVAPIVGPIEAEAQFDADQRYLGAHVGLSGVGSAPSFGLSGEISYNENIGLGGWMDTWSYGQSFSGIGGGSWDVRYLAIGGTGAWHFPVESNPKLDPFVGLGLGYFIVNTSWDGGGTTVSYSGDSSRIFLDGFAGLRYHFRPNLSGVVRAGASVSYLTLGLDYKI